MKNKNKNLLGMNEDEGQAKECKQPINKSINNVTFQRYNNDFMNQWLEVKIKKKKKTVGKSRIGWDTR